MSAPAADLIRLLAGMGPRPAGSPASEEVLALILERLSRLGLNTQVHEFPLRRWFTETQPILRIEGLGPARCSPMLGSHGGEFTGRLETHGSCTIWGMYSWPSYRVRGEDGGLNAYILVRPDGPAIAQPVPHGGAHVPHLVVGSELAGVIADYADRAAIVEGCLRVGFEESRGFNVRAWRGQDCLSRGGGPIIVTAHYDTVPDSPGAYDNAGGVAALMRVAQALATGRVSDRVQLLFTSAEELHLAGARAFVAELESEGRLAAVAACLNLDGAGRGDVLEVWVGPEMLAERLYPVLAPERVHFVFPPPPSGDHYAFWEKGIPALMLTYNDLAILHTPDDTFDPRKANNAERMARLATDIVPMILPKEAV